MIVQVKLQMPDVLVINQNYHQDWHTNRGSIFNKDGLIAVQLDETGSYEIRLRYIPRSFYAGLTISVLSLATLIFISWAYKTARLTAWTQHRLAFVKHSSRVILWLID